jgi:hypothetical protein
VEGLSRRTLEALRQAWQTEALRKHASVAARSRFVIALLSVGAPAGLVRDPLAAGSDAIRHAELCFTLASAYDGAPLAPDLLPVGRELPLEGELTSVVTEAVAAGCIGQTLAALEAAARLSRTTDPAVAAALRTMIEDETRHAELAWRVVTWAIRTGGETARDAAARTFACFTVAPPRPTDLEGVCLTSFAQHGRLTAAEAHGAAVDALEHVVRPTAAAMLDRDATLGSRSLAPLRSDPTKKP